MRHSIATTKTTSDTGRLFEVRPHGDKYVWIQLEPDSPVPGTSIVLPLESAKDLADEISDLTLQIEIASIDAKLGELGYDDEGHLRSLLRDLQEQL